MNYQQQARQVIQTELSAVQALHTRIGDAFDQACECIKQCTGRVIVLGIGKSGHIGHKMAATFSSTGTPAMFVHAAEASHGDFGMITQQDVILALSYSGTTPEVINLLPLVEKLSIPLISVTGNSASPLAQAADIHLDVSVDQEACPLNLAPTASTTVTLVMGDALAIALLVARGFTEADFAFSHPGGTLGKRLLLQVRDIMHTGEKIPYVPEQASLQEAILEMTQKRLGMTTIQAADGTLLGIYTDGDLRRTFERNLALTDTPIELVMTRAPKTIRDTAMAAEALQVMEHYKITCLAVTNDKNQITGILHIHNILDSGIM